MSEAKRHVNIPIFIPHLGCPNQCVFCNQKTISGVQAFKPESVGENIDEALKTIPQGTECEIAFFGGSFTGIDKELMERLLIIANRYIKQGRISSVRCSTRPDYINKDVLDLLWRYGVSSIELGLQSADDRVLAASRRGHTSADEEKACKLITEYGFTLGGQMMIGLPESTEQTEIATARFIVRSGAKEARIYPTVVFKDTELYELTLSGKYTPISLEDAVKRSAKALRILLAGGVKVLRIGLCDSENLHSDKTYYAGPNHPALGELVESELYFEIIREKLNLLDIEKGALLRITAPQGHSSKVIGHNKINKQRLLVEYGLSDVKVNASDSLDNYNVILTIEERTNNVLKNT